MSVKQAVGEGDRGFSALGPSRGKDGVPVQIATARQTRGRPRWRKPSISKTHRSRRASCSFRLVPTFQFRAVDVSSIRTILLSVKSRIFLNLCMTIVHPLVTVRMSRSEDLKRVRPTQSSKSVTAPSMFQQSSTVCSAALTESISVCLITLMHK